MHSVLVCSHTDRMTGFGRIARGIAQSLSAAYQVHVVGLGPGQECDSWSGHSHHRLDPTRTTALSELTRKLSPDAIILVGQGQLLAWQVTRLRRDGFTGAIIPYVPMEGPLRDATPLAELQDATMIAAYTVTGAADLEAALQATKEFQQPLVPISVIPHAIDRPLLSLPADRLKLRAALFPDHAHRAEGVWLLNGNRNDYRKRPELTMAAFALVAKELPQATLVLHCSPDRPGLDLRAERDRLGLGDNVIFTHDTYPDPLTERQLADLYASCDIGINTALAEGWGLIAFEHALCGAAQILPAHRGLQEIWGGSPLWIPVGEKMAIDDVFSGQAPGTAALSAAMRYLVVDAAARQQVAEACAARASDQCFGWERVGAMWRKMVAGAITAQRVGESERLIALWISA